MKLLRITPEGVEVRQATKYGYILCEWGGVFNSVYPSSKLRRGKVIEGGKVCPTITCGATVLYRIEKKK